MKSDQAPPKNLDHLNLCLKAAKMGVWEVEFPSLLAQEGKVVQPDELTQIKISWDEEMQRIHGMPQGQNSDAAPWFYKHIHPEDLPHLQDKTNAFLEKRSSEILHFTYRVCWPNQEIHYIDMYGSIEGCGPDEKLKMYGVAKDITQDVLRQKLLDDQKNRMISSSRMAILGEISGGIAHEINNPLTVIQARAFQLMQMAETNTFDIQKVKSAADSISKTGDKIAKIIKSLRAFAHSQENVPMDVVSVQELIQETLDFCKVRFFNHGIDIRVGNIPENLEFECRLIQIEEVLLNLFNNAHDAILPLAEKWIYIEAFDHGTEIEIHVTDSGPGISEEIADKMMLPFFTTKEIGRGMGLGLSIASDIVHKHSGQLYLDRSQNHTRFVIRLPKKQQLAVASLLR